MKQALQALLIAPNHEMRSKILTGEKRITLREGERDYKNGPVMIGCHIVPWVVMAEIINVSYFILGETPLELLQADGFIDHQDALIGLKKYYPNLTMDSKITVIEWDNVKGFLVDNRARYMEYPESIYSNLEHKPDLS